MINVNSPNRIHLSHSRASVSPFLRFSISLPKFPLGAAAYTGAVTHSLSIAVIVCETTGQLSALLPVLIALMVFLAQNAKRHGFIIN